MNIDEIRALGRIFLNVGLLSLKSFFLNTEVFLMNYRLVLMHLLNGSNAL